MSFADHFSTQATDYAKYRPGYPPALFEWLATLTPQHSLAWDVGTGNGQAAVQLAHYFEQVIATDPSAEQIRNAQPHERVKYLVQPAEESGLDDASVDLITVAQALHWFQFDKFYAQAHRVLKPRGVMAAWTYGLHEITPELDAILQRFYSDTVGSYWPPERRYIDECYRTIPFPFFEFSAPPMRLELSWALHDLIGYLGTWSSTQRYIRQHGSDPRELIYEQLKAAWGAQRERVVSWPMYFRVGGLQPMNASMLA
jgi:SAM-dependent methyltransferase